MANNQIALLQVAYCFTDTTHQIKRRTPRHLQLACLQTADKLHVFDDLTVGMDSTAQRCQVAMTAVGVIFELLKSYTKERE